MTRPGCVLIGGGVIGLSLAWELVRHGSRPLVLDQRRAGRGASWAGAGILPPANFTTALDPLEQLRGLSHELHARWAAELAEQTGIDTGYRRCGGLYLACSIGEAAALAGSADFWRQYGIEARRLSAEQLAADQPSLAPLARSGRLRAAWLLPGECQLRNPDHLRALAAACRAGGVEIREETTAVGLRRQGRRITAVQTSGGEIPADQVVLCGGAWTRRLTDRLQIPTGILPVRGQMVMYRCPEPPLDRVVNEGHRYLVPRDDGRLLVGSNEEEVGFVEETTPQVIASLRSWAEGLLPALAETPVERTWSGLRPATLDGFPYLGRVPETENLFVAAGHYRAGLHLSCGTALVMAQLLTGQPPAIDLTPFRLGRG